VHPPDAWTEISVGTTIIYAVELFPLSRFVVRLYLLRLFWNQTLTWRTEEKKLPALAVSRRIHKFALKCKAIDTIIFAQ
jgi:hypothetical protein